VSCLASLPILQHVTLSLPVSSFEGWTDGVFSDPSVKRRFSASVLSPKPATVAQWELSQIPVLEARLYMKRVSFLVAHMTLLLPVFSLERWRDDVSSNPSVSRLGCASVLSPKPIMQPSADDGK
jgi:hypothetical protein